jgi:sigma-B regulation protein RsbU (phosphoserine phosphatase)
MTERGEDKVLRRERYLELLADLQDEIASAQDITHAAPGILRRLAEALQAESASLFLLEGEFSDPRARLVCRACVGPSDITGLAVPAGSGIVGRTVATNTAQLIADVTRDPDFIPPQATTGYVIRSLMCAPLSLRGQRFGAVEVMNRLGPDPKFDAHDLELLEALATTAALALSVAQLTERLLADAKVRRELELASQVQRALLPPPQPDAAPVHGFNIPARLVSGDFYDILPLRGGRTAFALADVSGKGMNAALIMVKAATLFRSLGRQISDPGKLLAAIGRELDETLAMGMFVTMVVGVHDPARHEVRFANAGHQPPLLHEGGARFTAYPAEDPPLGIVRHGKARYHETRIDLSNRSLYVFTDGCTEGLLPDGSRLGVEGLRKVLQQHAGESARERLAALALTLQQSDQALHDDVTMIVIEDRLAGAPQRQPERRRPGRSVLVQQTLPAQIGQLKTVRRLVEAAAQQAGAASEWGRDLALAVDEAVQNIIRHGYGGDGKGEIQLRMKRLGDRIAVELVDFAPAVKEDRVKGRRLEDLRPGGLGVHFMHALTDKVQFLKPPSGAGNRLVLSKLLPKRRDPARK